MLSVDITRWTSTACSWLEFFHNIKHDTSMPHGFMEEIVVMLWFMWTSRNSLVFKGVLEHPSIIVAAGHSFLTSFRLASDVVSTLAIPILTLHPNGLHHSRVS